MSEQPVWKRRAKLLAHFAAYKLRHPRRRPGYVSVIVPVYNVEHFVGATLTSLAKQTYRRLEIVVVDDGSPDKSADIVRRHMATDRRIRLLQQSNRGLSGARNAGVRASRGEFVAFLDSDDTVTPRTYELAVASLRASGSDFAVFSYRRLNNLDFVQPGRWILQAHAKLRHRTTVTEFPDILVNAVAWSKVYTHDFWKRAGLSFPEGVLYEDQYVSAEAYLKSRSIDVLPEQLVNWRIRDDGQSITQQLHDFADLEARLDSVLASVRILAPNPVAHRARMVQVLTNDASHPIGALAKASEEFYALLRAKLQSMLRDCDESLWQEISTPMRIAYQLIEVGTREQVEAFVVAGGLHLQNYRIIHSNGKLQVDLPALIELDFDVDEWRTVLNDAEVFLRTLARRAWWDGDGALHLVGWAAVNGVDDSAQIIDVALADGVGGSVEFDVSQDYDDEVQLLFRHRYATYPQSHWHAVLPADRVPAGGTHTVRVSVAVNGIRRTGTIRSFNDLLRHRQLGSRLLADGRNMLLVASPDLDLAVEVRSGDPAVDRIELQGDALVVQLAATGPAVTGLRLTGSMRLAFRPLPGAPRSWIAELSSHADEWAARGDEDVVVTGALLAASARGKDQRVRWRRGEDFALLGSMAGMVLSRSSSPAGEVKISVHRSVVVVESIELHENVATLTGVAFGLGEAPRIEISRRSDSVDAPLTVAADGSFAVGVRLDAGQWGFAGTTLPRGSYGIVFHSGDEAVQSRPRAALGYIESLPVDGLTATMRVRATSSRGKQPTILVKQLIANVDRGTRGATELRKRNAELYPPIRSDAVLFRTFYGENTTCCARGIHRELVARGSTMKLYWTIKDYSVPVPQGGIGVVANSSEWYELMRSAKYLVDNVHQPDFFYKRPEQVFLQTLHGYPFKQMGLQYWREHGYSEQRIESFVRRAADWDYLLSPATYATPLLREAFGYSGEMLELGYPRNDILLAPDADALGQEVRARLGIAGDALVVLYAPTWRDWLSSSEFMAPMVDYFDYDEFSREFGADAVLLLRGHAMNARHKNRVGSVGSIIDVTDYPEISDLILACDAAVVDYSSIRFDLGVAGKPMIFLVPDLERYNADRGSLMEFEPTAPGPLVSTTADVIACLRDLDGMRAEYAPAYEKFRSGYLDLDDGHAGARVVDAVFDRADLGC